MKKSIVAGLMIALACAGSLVAQEHKGPRIEVRELRHDFGKVVQGTLASHVFEVKSVGDEALVIEKVQPS